jgi:transposase
MINFYNGQHAYYCGVDLHKKTMFVYVLNDGGETVFHKNIRTRPDEFLRAIAPYREGLVVAVECMFAWYWLADLCRREGIAFVLGHALYMRAIHGTKTKNDREDSYKIARLLRGGNFPLAYVYPAEWRPTRDLLRRRSYFVRCRAELLTHIQNTVTQYNLSPLKKKIAYKANREGVAEHFPDPMVRKSIEADLEMLDYFDEVIGRLELEIERTAKIHDPHTFFLLKTVPGVGRIIGLTLLYEICTVERFPDVSDFMSYCRLVRPPKTSAGKPTGEPSGKKIGNRYLKWAFSEATLLLVRESAYVKKQLARLESKHNKGKALSILSARLGRAVYHMLRKGEAFDMRRFLGQA